MTVADFTRYLSNNNCDLTPMPDWNRASTLRITNRARPDLRPAFLNTNIDGDLFPSVIEGICTRLAIPLPPNYAD